MDNLRLRAVVIKLQDRLNDDDRRRLHFFFGNDVPRQIRDDLTLGGTLHLIESLFDQDKINEHDFTYLIDALEQIKCFDAAQLLREYKQQSQIPDTNLPMQTLSSVLPQNTSSLSEECQEDKVAFHNLTSYRIQEKNEIKPSAPPEPQVQLNLPDNDERKSLRTLCSVKKCIIGIVVFTVLLLTAIISLAVGLSVSHSQAQKIMKNSLEQLDIQRENVSKTNTSTTIKLTDLTTTTDPRGFWIEGTTCGCAQWCRQHRHDTPFGVCGDGHTCICRDTPITKAKPHEGCTCDSWCQQRGHPNGGICGDGYTCICS